jgi:hypothetical protein
MWAFLVARSDEEDGNVKKLLNNFLKEETLKKLITEPKMTWPLPIHTGAYTTLSSKGVIEKSSEGPWYLLIYLIIVIPISVCIVYLAIQDKNSKKKRKIKLKLIENIKNKNKNRKRKNVLALISLAFLIAIFFLASFFIYDIEESAAGNYGYESPFNKMGYYDASMWLVIFTVSGTEKGILPFNPYSEWILLVFNLLLKLGIPGIIGYYFYESLAEYWQDKPWLPKKPLAGHVVFIGWNKIYSPMVKIVVEKEKDFKFVIIAPDSPNLLEESDLPPRNVAVLSGYPQNPEILKKAYIDEAQRIYLVSPEGEDVNYLTSIPVYFETFLKKLSGKETPLLPPIFILDPEGKRKPVFERFVSEKTNILERPNYKRFIQSLFFGSGIYSFLTHWVKFSLQDKEKHANDELALSEIILGGEMPAKENGNPLFEKLRHARDALSFCNAYNDVDEALEQRGSTLVGISINYRKDTENDKIPPRWAYFSAPEVGDGGADKFDIEKAVLYIMNYELGRKIK